MTASKTCSKCREERIISEFAKKDDSRLRSECKSCCAKRVRKYYEANKVRAAARNKAWRAANKEKLSAIHKEWRQNRRDDLLAYHRAYYQANRDAARGRSARFKKNNRDLVAVHFNARRAREREATGSHSVSDITEIRLLQKDRCGYCRVALRGMGHVDHIKPISLGGSNNRRNIQMLCAPCNLKKHAKPPEKFARELGLLI